MSAPNVDKAGGFAALSAFMMNDPHPGGYLWDSPASRVGRAVYAYEWAKLTYPMDEKGWQVMPQRDEVRAAVLSWESTEEPLNQ